MSVRNVLLGCIALIFCGCSEPALLTNVTPTTLKQAAGSRVTVEGLYSLHKAGDVVNASGIDIPFYASGASESPADSSPIAVSGTLVEVEDISRYDYPYRIDDATWTKATLPGS